MKKTLPFMAAFGITMTTVVQGNIFDFNQTTGINPLQIAPHPQKSFTEGVNVTSESRNQVYKPDTTVEFTFTVSFEHLKAIANKAIDPSQFVQILPIIDYFGTKINDPNYLLALEKELANLLINQIDQFIIYSSNQGATIQIKSITPWDDSYFIFYHESTLPYVNYQIVQLAGDFDKTEKWFRAFSPDELRLDISQETWQQMAFLLTDHNFQAIYVEMLSLFPQSNHAGIGGLITTDDFKTLVQVLLNNWESISNKFNSTLESVTGWKIIVATDGTYSGMIPE